uniref:Major facilitator superfamily protein n=1 Tax=Zea mays TaxID=4577 RepID=A0A804UL56_MAIZE
MAGMRWGRWLGLVMAVWVQCISGNNYTFSNYSHALKTLMGLTQLQLNGLSVAKDVGKAFGLLAGLAYDRVPTWLLLTVGSLEGLLGYDAQWMVVSGAVAPLPYWQICVFLCLDGNSTTWMNTAVLVTCIRNFRRSRGPVSGLLKGYVGLSTAIFTDTCSALFTDDPTSFLVMLAVVPAAVCALTMVFLREGAAAVDDEDDGLCFAAINLLAVAIALYLLAADLTRLGTGAGSSLSPCSWCSSRPPLPCRRSWRGDRGDPTVSANADLEEADSLVAAAVPLLLMVKEARAPEERLWLGEEHTIAQTLTSLDFWLMFASFLMGVGTGLAVMNNLGQMDVAMGYIDVSLFVSMTSIWGFFGRIASGTISEHFINDDNEWSYKEKIEFTTYFAQEISEGLLFEMEDQIPSLAELIKFGSLLDFQQQCSERYRSNFFLLGSGSFATKFLNVVNLATLLSFREAIADVDVNYCNDSVISYEDEA